MNILFVMYDQLRFDYLSCYGHPDLDTPNFDRIASQGVRFTNAYVQSPICGPSRMSFYTGRYTSSHGSQWNKHPLRVGEMTMGDHLRDAGMDCWLIGKTHMKPDYAGLERLGIDPKSKIGKRIADCGFDTWVRDDGLWAQGPDGYYEDYKSPYNAYLNSKGYDGENPWADYANAGIEGNKIASGWFLENADKQANIKEEDSETPWLTREAMAFLDQAKGSWCAHVSYIKPHWPYIAPAPYHNMYGPNNVPAAVRTDAERENAHPVYNAFMHNPIAKAWQTEGVREKVIPTYMGLIKQCDDQLGVLLDHLEATGHAKDTIIVLTSDHGDYLGDHHLGEKNLFHDPSVKVPMIIMDPRPSADSARGTVCDALVESIDLAATFVDVAAGSVPSNILEGRSLMPWINGETPQDWRDFVISEYDYSGTPICERLGLEMKDARIFMLFDGRYKLWHAEGGFRPMLFDLEEDPQELVDLGESEDHQEVLAMMYRHMTKWGLRMSQRTSTSDDTIIAMRTRSRTRGVLPFMVDGSEVEPELIEKYVKPARQNHIDNT